MKFIFYIFIGCVLCVACNKEEDEKEILAKRTIIFYMAADNDLSIDALADLEGLSCYIPHPDHNDLNEYYQTLSLYAASGLNFLF